MLDIFFASDFTRGFRADDKDNIHLSQYSKLKKKKSKNKAREMKTKIKLKQGVRLIQKISATWF